MKRKLILLFFAIILALPIFAQRKTYDPRRRLIGLTVIEPTPDRGWTNEMGFMFVDNPINTSRFYGPANVNDIQKWLEDENLGKKVLDYLFNYNGRSANEDLLKSRAYSDSNLDDEERASATYIGSKDPAMRKTILEENYMPILDNNYIYLESGGKWFVFHVEINMDIALQVFNCWDNSGFNASRYNSIQVKVKKVKKGLLRNRNIFDFLKKKSSKEKQITNEKVRRRVGKRVTAFALRGKVISRNPFMGDIGLTNNIENGDRFYVFRSFARDTVRNGSRYYSKKIATARAVQIDYNSSIFHTIAGGFPSGKTADVLVYRPDKKVTASLNALYQPSNKVFGLSFQMTYAMSNGFMRHGWTKYFMMDCTASGFDRDKNIEQFEDDNNDLMIYSFGGGYGMGYSFLHRFELMPYFIIGAQYSYSRDAFITEKNPQPDDEGKYQYSHGGWALQPKVGMRLNTNIIYPLQLTIAVEYAFNFGNQVYKSQVETYGMKKNYLSLYAGFKYNF